MGRIKSVDWLLGNIDKVNLVPDMDDKDLGQLCDKVVRGYEIDENSRQDWHRKTEDGLKVAKQLADKKTFPWTNAANVKYPLIATASIQFAARAYPQIIQGNDIVKTQVLGKDRDGAKEARAKRISQHMSWQLLEQMPEWERDMDQLLHGLPVMGTYFKKTFFNTLYKRNQSISLNPFEVVVNLKHKGTLDTCRRITHKIMLYKNEVIERENIKLFVEGIADKFVSDKDIDEQELFLEQHCWYDMDGDGYEEPYIVTVHYDSRSVARIVANYDIDTIDFSESYKVNRISPVQYFTKFSFIPSPDGEFYDIGFAHLLGPINEAMSTLINQLLDAGSLSNTGGGFISKGLRWNGGRLQFELGEWKPVDAIGMSLKDAILPLPVREPSQVLFQLLGLLNEAGNKLASVSDTMAGEMPSQNTPATTTLAMIEQGLKVFTAIYKRLYRSLKEEFKKLYRLNGIYMEKEEYYRFMDEQGVVFRKDYGTTDLDITPVADPTMSSEAQRLARANALLQTLPMNPTPEGKAEILYQYYDSIGAKNLDKLMNMAKIQQMNENPPPNPDMMKLELDTQKAKDDIDIRMHDIECKKMEAVAKVMKLEAEIDLIKAQTMETIAKAEAVEPGTQLDQYKLYLDNMKAEQQHERELKKIGLDKAETGEESKEVVNGGETDTTDTEGSSSGMASEPNNEGSVGMPKGGEVSTPGIPNERTNLDVALSGSNGDANYLDIGEDLRSESNLGNGG